MKITRLRLHIGASRVHRWLGLIIGAQLLVWCTSGLLMSLLPLDLVHGDRLVDKAPNRPLAAETLRRFAPLPIDSRPVSAITIRTIVDRPMATIHYADGHRRLIDLANGRERTVDRALADRIARDGYKGRAVATGVELVTSGSTEYRGALPAWRVAFADDDATRVYVDAATGEISAIRTGTWRFYDLVWALHIMDWKGHQDFNTFWLRGFAFGGLSLGIAGAILLYFRWPKRRRGPAKKASTKA